MKSAEYRSLYFFIFMTNTIWQRQVKMQKLSQRIFISLNNPVFCLYYGALLCHRASMNMQMVARSLLIYRLTGSAVILGSVALAHALPMICLSLFGGVIADRVHKKYVLLIGQACSAFVALGIALSLGLVTEEQFDAYVDPSKMIGSF